MVTYVSVWRGVPEDVLCVEKVFCAHWLKLAQKRYTSGGYCRKLEVKLPTWLPLGIRLAMLSTGSDLIRSQITKKEVRVKNGSRHESRNGFWGNFHQKRCWRNCGSKWSFHCAMRPTYTENWSGLTQSLIFLFHVSSKKKDSKRIKTVNTRE